MPFPASNVHLVCDALRGDDGIDRGDERTRTMAGIGLFGKLPFKRDFVASRLPRHVLEPFENWLQAGVAASHDHLGDDWSQLYLIAPIWHFWVGDEIMGTYATGSIMPSVDKVGRFFPLAMLSFGDEGEKVMAPPFNPVSEWHATVKERLLSVLKEDAADTLTVEDLLEGIEVPQMQALEVPDVMDKGTTWSFDNVESMDDALGAVAQPDYLQLTSNRSYFWTDSITNDRKLVHVCAGLPDPYFFTQMITVT